MSVTQLKSTWLGYDVDTQILQFWDGVKYQPLISAAGYVTPDDLADYLLETDAASTYLTISTASSTYLTISNASSTYATISSLSSYLTTSAAASTYATKDSPTFTGLSIYADDAAAGAGGLTTGQVYKTATGALMIKL